MSRTNSRVKKHTKKSKRHVLIQNSKNGACHQNDLLNETSLLHVAATSWITVQWRKYVKTRNNA